MKCYGCMPSCKGTALNNESFCGPCTKAKRDLGQVVVNKGSPQNTAKSVASKKQKIERSKYEQSLCDSYALQCMSQCIRTLRAPSLSARCLVCACFNMRNADCASVIVNTLCTRWRFLCDHIKTREFQTQLLHYFSKSDNKSNHHQLPELQPDPKGRWGRGTPQIQRRRGLEREGSQVHSWVFLPNPVLHPRQPLVSCATAWACASVIVNTLCTHWRFLCIHMND